MLFPSRRPTFWLSTAFGQNFFCRVMLNWKIGIWADFFLKKHRMNNSYDVFLFFILFIYLFILQMNYSYDFFSKNSPLFQKINSPIFLNYFEISRGCRGFQTIFWRAFFKKNPKKFWKIFFLPNASKNIFFSNIFLFWFWAFLVFENFSKFF